MAHQPEISILYITERILVLTYPSGEDEGAYRSSLRHVSRMLRTKHGPCYKIFNSSQRRRDLAALNPGIVEFGWPEHLAPPLERICSICKDIDNWLTADKRHLAVLHENGGACRSAVIVACFMHYQQICANEDLALDRFAMRKFFNEQRVSSSQKRYVNYFAGLLASEIRINSNPIFLYQVVVYGIPRASKLYLKIYEKMAPVYLSSVYKNNAPILTIRLNPPVCLRGDIIFKCCKYGNELLFRCQFNTCAVDAASSSCFSFTSRELDDISYEDAGLDLLFSFNRETPMFGETSSSSAMEVDSIEDLGGVDRCNSYENFDSLAEDDVTSNNISETNGHSPHPLVRERELSANDTADSGIHSVVDGDTEQVESVEVHNQGKRVIVIDSSAKELNREISVNGTGEQSKIERKVYNREPEEVVMSTSLRSGTNGADASQENGTSKAGYTEHRLPPLTPPSKRTFSPLMRPVSPAVVDDSRIDSDLVPTDRYDPQSRAFSYVPLQSLQEHFKSPRKPPTQLVQKIERTSRSTPSSPPPTDGEYGHDDKRGDHEYSSVIKPKSSSVQGPLSSSDIDQLLDPNFYLNFTEEDALPRYQSNKSPHLGLSSYESSTPSSSAFASGAPPPFHDENNDVYPHAKQEFYVAPASASKKVPPPVMAKPSRRLDPAEESLLRDLEEYEARNSVPPSPKPLQMNYANERPRTYEQQQPTQIITNGRKSPRSDIIMNKERSPPQKVLPMPPTLSMPPPPPISQQPSPPKRYFQQEPRWDDVFSDVSFARASPPRQLKTQPHQKVVQESPSDMLNRTASPTLNAVTRSFGENAPPYLRKDDPFSKLHYGLKMDSPPLQTSDDSFEHIYASKPLVKKTRSIPDDYITAPWLDDSETKHVDPWLEYQMEKLRVRREVNDPDVQRRKEQEKLLLEELKHVHDERMVRNNKREADYTVEGFGVKTEELPVFGIRHEDQGYANKSHEQIYGHRHPDQGYPIRPQAGRADEPIYGLITEEESYGFRTQEPNYNQRTQEPGYTVRTQEPGYPVRTQEPGYTASPGYTGRPQEPVYGVKSEEQVYGIRTQEQDYGVRTEERLRSKPTDFIVLKREIIDNPQDIPSRALITRQWSDSAYNPQHYGYNNDYHSSNIRTHGNMHRNLREQHSPSPPPSGAFLHESHQGYKVQTVSPSTTWRSPSAPPEGATDFSRLQDILWDAESSRSAMTPTPSLSKVSSPKSILKKPKSADAQTSTVSTQFSSVPNQFFNGYRENVDSPSSRVFELEPAQPPSNTFESSSQASYRPETPSSYRPETPAFPVRRAETPLPYHPLLYSGASEVDSKSPGGNRSAGGLLLRSPSPASQYYGHSRRSSLTSLLEPMEIVHQHPVFVKDTSKYWYKPNITRDEAISILKDKPPGTFIIRDSNSFPGAFGLALKVATPPPGVQTKSNDGSELVRHFLIEPTAKGVKLKGCNNEPVFGSLAALVYQHSITPLALPCKLLLPDYDPSVAGEHINTAQALLEQGAACNVTYLFSCDTESLTGPEAVRRAVDQALTLAKQKTLAPVSVHFKVSTQGITITDNTRKVFFRRHYPVNTVTFCGLDPDDRRWSLAGGNQTARIFGFVGRKIANKTENACHIFAEYEPEQPASAIVNFVTKVMMAPLHSASSSSTLK